MLFTRAEEQLALQMQEKISTLEKESSDLVILNQEQTAAFIHENKELELWNNRLSLEVETLRRSSAGLEEQASLCFILLINSFHKIVPITRRFEGLRVYWQVWT